VGSTCTSPVAAGGRQRRQQLQLQGPGGRPLRHPAALPQASITPRGSHLRQAWFGRSSTLAEGLLQALRCLKKSPLMPLGAHRDPESRRMRAGARDAPSGHFSSLESQNGPFSV
jgi:hypothetical protein